MQRAAVVFAAVAVGLFAREAAAQTYRVAPPAYDDAYADAPFYDAPGALPDDEPASRAGSMLIYRDDPLAPPAEVGGSPAGERTGSIAPYGARRPLFDRSTQDEASAPPGGVGPDGRPPADMGATGSPAPPRSEAAAKAELPAQFRRQLVRFSTREPAGTIVVDTAHTYLYYVLGNGDALRYGIGVGREGFTWTGRERVSRMAEWPDWHPPTEMIARQPYLPRFMAGGPGNPLGARALYLGSTIYRIHGTNEPHTIGKFVSSGCIRLLNEDIQDLYRRVSVGTQVVVLPKGAVSASAAAR